MYRFGTRNAGTRERLPVSEAFHILLRLCDTNAETDPDQTLRMLVISNLHPKYAVMTYCLGKGTDILKMYKKNIICTATLM